MHGGTFISNGAGMEPGDIIGPDLWTARVTWLRVVILSYRFTSESL
jgi:hypothetical protein